MENDFFITGCELLTFSNSKNFLDYFNLLKKYIEQQCAEKNFKMLSQISNILYPINSNNIPVFEKKEIEELKQIFDYINTILYKLDNKESYYIVKKYLRAITDLIINENIDYDVLISVIIPVYNVEKYLKECLDSLINQSLKNIEIICVDDMSTDSSYDILKSYEKKDSRITTISMEKKGGSGGCRNLALKYAKGKYVLYVDADDYLDIKALETLYKQAEKQKVQILMFKPLCFNDNKEFYKKEYYELCYSKESLYKILSVDDLKNIFKIPAVPWNKLYLKSFLLDINPSFPENIIHQDNPFFYETFLQADRIYFIDEYYYYHRERSDSITNLNNKVKLGHIEMIEYVLKVFLNNHSYNRYKVNLLNHLFFHFITGYKIIKKEYKKEYYEKSKVKINKFITNYYLENDFRENLCLDPKLFFDSVINSKNYYEFRLMSQNKFEKL